MGSISTVYTTDVRFPFVSLRVSAALYSGSSRSSGEKSIHPSLLNIPANLLSAVCLIRFKMSPISPSIYLFTSNKLEIIRGSGSGILGEEGEDSLRARRHITTSQIQRRKYHKHSRTENPNPNLGVAP